MGNSPRCLYNSSVSEFYSADENAIFGVLCDNYHGDALTTTREAWKAELSILKRVLPPFQNDDGQIIFEYDIPRLGKRIDVVLLLRGIVFCLEFKVGESRILEADVDQVLDYALDLKNFHKFSQDRVIVPILIATNYRASSSEIQMSVYDDKVVNPLVTGEAGLGQVIAAVLDTFPGETPVNPRWIISPYAPTPTIIEAARTLYENHTVENITRHEADEVSTDRTIAFILKVIRESKATRKKSICFVTGVPGAGKTLVGLDVAIKQTYQGKTEPVKDEGAVYLSGNGPLVAVLTEALAQDNYKKSRDKGDKKKLTDSRREVGKSIQMIHRYRDNMLAKIKNPVENGVLEIDPEKAVKLDKAGYGEVEHVAIFDEAQRSWTHKRLADYLKRGGTYGNKLKVPNFPVSEAAFLIWSLDQREDWATIICLVGGGQEINTGEAGISEWIKALNERFPDWLVYISPKLTDAEYAEGKVNELLKNNPHVSYNEDLHLSVSLSSNCLTSKKTGQRLQNSAFDIGGGRPKIYFVPLDHRLLGVFYYEGQEYDFNFSKLHLKVKTDFSFEEHDEEVIWYVRQENIHAAMETEVHCLKQNMLLINYEAPDGSRHHNRLWNGGNGWGTIKLYDRQAGRLVLADEIEATHIGCEYGEYDHDEPYSSEDRLDGKNGKMNEEFRDLDRIERVKKYERLFDEAVSTHDLEKLQMLEAYYSSGKWREDYEADERGELPPDLKRGVLSQDVLYNLLEEADL